MLLHDERRKQQEEEMNKRIEEYKDNQRKNSGVKIGDVFIQSFLLIVKIFHHLYGEMNLVI